MVADGIDPIETKHQAKSEAVIKGRTFESVALDWHREVPSGTRPLQDCGEQSQKPTCSR